jgi:hypothetical protein
MRNLLKWSALSLIAVTALVVAKPGEKAKGLVDDPSADGWYSPTWDVNHHDQVKGLADDPSADGWYSPTWDVNTRQTPRTV